MGRRIFQILPMFLSRLIASVVFFAHAPSTPSFKHINKVWPFSPSFAVSSDCISRIGDGKIIVTLPIESYDESQIVLPIYKVCLFTFFNNSLMKNLLFHLIM